MQTYFSIISCLYGTRDDIIIYNIICSVLYNIINDNIMDGNNRRVNMPL